MTGWQTGDEAFGPCRRKEPNV